MNTQELREEIELRLT